MNTVFWIIEFVSTFAELFLFTIFYESVIKSDDFKKNYRKRIIISVIIAAVMMIINHINIFSYISSIFGLVLIVVLSILLYPKSRFKSPMLAAIFLLIIATIDNVVINTISFALKISLNEIYQEFSLYRVLAIISSKTLLLLFVIIINKLFSKKRTLQRRYLFILFGVTTVMFFVTVLITFMEIKNKAVNSVISILFFAVMLILLMIIFFGTFKLTEYYENQEELKLTTLKNQMLEKSMSETEQTFMIWKKSMHDYKHNIANLITLADNNNLDGIKAYLQSENKLLTKKLFYYKTGNDTIDTILNIKQRTAEDKGIAFIISAEIPEKCPVSSAHFASVLGNLLDNAIEASIDEESPFVEVKIKPVKSYLMIVVSNKCTKSNIELKTTKSDKQLHGIGINSVKQTVKEYKGTFLTDHTDGIFNAEIMIPM